MKMGEMLQIRKGNRDDFLYFSIKTNIVTPHWKGLTETVLNIVAPH